jgi:hypothetical protein
MEYVIDDFSNGLDTRRTNLTTSQKALVTAQNVHINQGAQIEKRRAFVDVGSLPSSVYGLELTSNGLVVFGSVSTPSLPSGIGYVQCVHPSDTSQGMTAVLCSCSFGGKAWCAAKFANNDVFLYYNGTVIPASMNGQVLSTKNSNLNVATQLYNFVNTAYFTSLGIKASAPVLIGSSYYVDIYATPGVSFTITAAPTSASGTLATLLISNASQGTAFTQANFGFSTSMGNTGTLSAVDVSTDGGVTFGVHLLGTAVSWAGTDATGYATALNIASVISSSLNTLPITAKANNNQVTLLADSSVGSTPNGYPVKLTATGDFCLDSMVLDLSGVSSAFTSGTGSTSLLVGSLQTVFNGQIYSGGGSYVSTALPAGTYFWHKGANDVSMAVAGGATFYADDFFTIGAPTNITFSGTASAAVTAQLTKMIEILGGNIKAATPAALVTAMAAQIRTNGASAGYTACASQSNKNQLFVSRLVVRSDYQFYPVLASDITNVAGINGTVVQTKAVLTGYYIPFVVSDQTSNFKTASGVLNVSIVGGAAPFVVSAVAGTNSGGNNGPASFVANFSNVPVTGSFLVGLTATKGAATGTSTQQYNISTQDAVGQVATNVLTLTGVVNGSGVFTSFTVSFV